MLRFDKYLSDKYFCRMSRCRCSHCGLFSEILTFHGVVDVRRVSFRYENSGITVTFKASWSLCIAFILSSSFKLTILFLKEQSLSPLLCCTAPVAARSRKMGREIVPPDIKLILQKFKRNYLKVIPVALKNYCKSQNVWNTLSFPQTTLIQSGAIHFIQVMEVKLTASSI